MQDFETVLAAAQHGDGRSAEQLFRAFQPMLLRYLRSQERRVADDLSGEVWLAAAEGLQKFHGDEEGYRAWLFTVPRRRVIEHRRKGIRRRTEVVDPERFDEASARDDPASAALDAIEAQDAVDLIARTLTADQAEVLILRTVADLSAADVASLMDRPETWVRVRSTGR